ncbi:MAG TPA: GntR family transcriptional regulator [Actinomycetota bacterium]
MVFRIEIVPGGPPASAQAREALRDLIDRGEILPGERLPTVRALAADAALAPNTVARAYRELEEAGYLEGRGRAGTFVVEEPPPVSGDAEAALADAADRYLVRAKQLGFDASAATHALDVATRRTR